MDGTVLEIKFTDVYPLWVRDLVASFELERRSISKYARAFCHARGDCPVGPMIDGPGPRMRMRGA